MIDVILIGSRIHYLYLCIDFIHMSQDPHCPQCNSEYPYPSGDLWICPECAHEWSLSEQEESESGLVDLIGAFQKSTD